MRRASSRAGFAWPWTSGRQASRRRAAWARAASTAAVPPGSKPRRSQTTNSGVARWPRAARGMKPGGQPITGAPALPARRASSPPDDTATTCAPAASAAAVASSVSSVPPEYDMAKNSVPGPTNRGARYCLSTVTGTVRSWEPAVASTSPEMPEPPIPQTATLVIAAPATARQVDRSGRRPALRRTVRAEWRRPRRSRGCRSRQAFRSRREGRGRSPPPAPGRGALRRRPAGGPSPRRAA